MKGNRVALTGFPPHVQHGKGKVVAGVIESPCILVCTMDEQAGLCLGCGRTLDEISAWASISPAERNRIMAMLPARRAEALLADQWSGGDE